MILVILRDNQLSALCIWALPKWGEGVLFLMLFWGVRTLARIAWGKFLLVNHQVQTGLCFFLGKLWKGPKKKGLTEGGGGGFNNYFGNAQIDWSLFWKGLPFEMGESCFYTMLRACTSNPDYYSTPPVLQKFFSSRAPEDSTINSYVGCFVFFVVILFEKGQKKGKWQTEMKQK